MIEASIEERAGWKLWLLWLGANLLGWTVGQVFYQSLGGFWNQWPLALILGIAALLLMGLALGALQALVLLHRLPGVYAWVLATGLGVLVGLFAGIYFLLLYMNAPGPFDWSGLAQGALLGLALGFAQWLVLRRSVQRAGWWVLVNVLAWSLGFLAAFLVTGAAVGTAATTFSGAVTGLVSGALTGVALVWLLR
jgi:hypothetical protein